MASGADHLLMLDNIGDVWSLGCAESGQLGRVRFSLKKRIFCLKFEFSSKNFRSKIFL